MGDLPLPYVPIDPLLEESERFIAFVDACGLHSDPFAEFYIHKLLLFLGRSRIDGDLGQISPRALAAKCKFPGDPEQFHDALVASGWLVSNDKGGWRVEGWERHGGRVLANRLRWSRAKRGKHDENDSVDAADTVEVSGEQGVSAEVSENSADVHEEEDSSPRGVRAESALTPRGLHSLKCEVRSVKCETEDMNVAENTTRAEATEHAPKTPPDNCAASGVPPTRQAPNTLATVEDVTAWVAHQGWQVVLSPTQIVKATALLDRGPIEAVELAWAREVTLQNAKTQGCRPSVALLLGVISNERHRVANTKPRPGSEHAAVEREGRERSPPKRTRSRTDETPTWAKPVDVREILNQAGVEI